MSWQEEGAHSPFSTLEGRKGQWSGHFQPHFWAQFPITCPPASPGEGALVWKGSLTSLASRRLEYEPVH